MLNVQERSGNHARARTQRPGEAATAGARRASALLAAAHRVAIISSGVLAGAILGTWLSEASFGGSAEPWIAYHQAITSAYTGVVPPIGGLAMIATLTALAGSWRTPRTRWLLVAAAGCLVIGMLVTVLVHFPINDEIMTWQPSAPPADWQERRDGWLIAHAVRTVIAMAGFVLLVVAATLRRLNTHDLDVIVAAVADKDD